MPLAKRYVGMSRHATQRGCWCEMPWKASRIGCVIAHSSVTDIPPLLATRVTGKMVAWPRYFHRVRVRAP